MGVPRVTAAHGNGVGAGGQRTEREKVTENKEHPATERRGHLRLTNNLKKKDMVTNRKKRQRKKGGKTPGGGGEGSPKKKNRGVWPGGEISKSTLWQKGGPK